MSLSIRTIHKLFCPRPDFGANSSKSQLPVNQSGPDLAPNWHFMTNLSTFFWPCSLGCEILVKSPRKCEKWILYKILHRLSDPIFFLLKKFRCKKIISKLKLKKYFQEFWKSEILFFSKKSRNKMSRFFSVSRFFFGEK